MDHATLAKRVKEVALLEGDFTLRSGKKSKFYFDKYLFETQPDVLEAMGKEIAGRLPEGTRRIAGPELGAVALAAAASLASRGAVLYRAKRQEGLWHGEDHRGEAGGRRSSGAGGGYRDDRRTGN